MTRFWSVLLSVVIAGTLLTHRFQATTTQAQPAPQTVTIPGLRDRVTVRRDERGIPYIEAANDQDLYFAQGYVTASDRLWQMDLLRRTVRGELSEIFGANTLSSDKTHRTLGLGNVIDESAKRLPPNLKLAMEAYASGVNAYIDSLNDQNTPPEFRILQFKPRHWAPADSLAVGKLLAEFLSNTWQLDLMRATLAPLPKDKRDALLPETSPLDVLVVGSDKPNKTSKSEKRDCATCGALQVRADQFDRELIKQLALSMNGQREMIEVLGLPASTYDSLQASNNWVVSGKRTTTGKPLLANDPHITAAAPGIWYQTELIAPGMHVAGVTFPGAPGIVLGHNERIAWGATNLGPDVQDVYLEKFDKENPNRYLTPNGWRDAEIRHEPIKVRKNLLDPNSVETQTLDVTVTRHGPIVLEKDGSRYALRWTALDPATLESAGLFEANRAGNWKDFTEALSHYTGPTQNFIYADVDGHIGYYGAGRIPIRKSGDGSVPYDGATDDGEWMSFIPFDKLPHVYDPPAGVIVTANQRIAGTDYPYFLSHVWAQPYRARRIFDLISAKPKLSADDFRRIQSDVYSIASANFAKAAAKILKSLSEPGAVATGPSGSAQSDLNQLINDLENWDGMISAESRTAVVVSQLRLSFRQRILNAALGPLASGYFWPEQDVLIDRIITEQPREWLPKEFASYADLLKASYEEARQTLTRNLGADDSKWSWGAQTKARFNHPLAQAPLIGLQFAIPPFPQNGTAGSGATVNVGPSVSMRLIADPSDWDKTLNGIPLGESGWPASPHWKDQLDDWRNVTPRPFPFSQGAVAAATKETTTLAPQR
jgi:penicillin amidase